MKCAIQFFIGILAGYVLSPSALGGPVAPPPLPHPFIANFGTIVQTDLQGNLIRAQWFKTPDSDGAVEDIGIFILQ